MFSLLHRLHAGLKKMSQTRGPRSRPADRRVRLAFESLEDRRVMSTLFLTPSSTPLDATHFHRFQDAYQAAKNGDIIQVEKGAVVQAVPNVVGQVVAGGAVGTQTVTTNNLQIGAGEWVNVDGGPNFDRTNYFVTDAHVNSNQTVTLTLNTPLVLAHNGAGATVTTVGTLGMAKSITLQGDPTQPLAFVNSDFEIPAATHQVTFKHLQFLGFHSLALDQGAQNDTVENCTIFSVGEGIGPGAGNGGNVFDHNVLGAANLNGVNGQGGDRITNNVFTGARNTAGGLFLTNNNGALVQGNRFELTRPSTGLSFTALSVTNSSAVTIRNNDIDVIGGDQKTRGILLETDSFFSGTTTGVVVEGNGVNTGHGLGLVVDSQSSLVSAKVQGNDFRFNGTGVSITGTAFGTGNIDLGGGSLGSLGGNDFQGFTPDRAKAGEFAIALHMPTFVLSGSQITIEAHHNVFSVSDPTQVCQVTGLGFIDF
jgi:hypothetical protein